MDTYSVELLQDRSIFIQTSKDRIKHGAKGKVLLLNVPCFKIAQQIKFEDL